MTFVWCIICYNRYYSAGKEVQVVSLFDQKNIKGWWPCYCDYDPSIPRELTVGSFDNTVRLKF